MISMSKTLHITGQVVAMPRFPVSPVALQTFVLASVCPCREYMPVCLFAHEWVVPDSPPSPEYWAGSLEIHSLEGFGVDAFLQISKLGNKDERCVAITHAACRASPLLTTF